MKFPLEGLLQVPFGRLDEVADSPRYHWDNGRRGKTAFVILQCTHRGEGSFELDGERHRVPPGHVFIALLPENSRYSYPAGGGEPWVFSWINFYGEWAVPLWTSLRNQSGPVISLPPAVLRRFRHLAARAGKRNWIDRYEASRASYEFYLETLRHAPRPNMTRPFQEVIAYFQAHYQEGVRMKEVAALAGMSREHFTRLFTRQMGGGPASYLRQIRLEAATRLLRTTELPIIEVALRSGWSSATRFDLFFKRHHGVSPREYRIRQSKTKLP